MKKNIPKKELPKFRIETILRHILELLNLRKGKGETVNDDRATESKDN